MAALAALELEDEDEDHAGDPRPPPYQPLSIPVRHRYPPLRCYSLKWISNLRFASLLREIPSPLTGFNTLLTVELSLLLTTGTAQIPEPPDPPDPPDRLRQDCVWIFCLCCCFRVIFIGNLSKSQRCSPPPRPASAISAGKKPYSGLRFNRSLNCFQQLSTDVCYHVLGMINSVLSRIGEKVMLVYSHDKERSSTTTSTDELQFSWFSNLAILAYSCDKERFSTALSTDELQFSWFSNLAILQLWLRSEFTNLSAIIINTFTSYLSPLYVLVYIPRVLSIYLEWCCHQRTSFRLVKVFLIPKSRNPFSFMDRGSLSSATRIFMSLRAIYLGLKKAYFKTVACQISTIQKPVDWDFIVSILEGGLVLRKASDKALSFVNLFSNDRCFGSLLISKDSTYLLCMIFDSIMLLYFWFFSFTFVKFESILVWDWSVVTGP